MGEPGGGSAGGCCYLDVAAVRIQQWLARTPDLKGWRGASAALSQATARDRWDGALPEGMEWNPDAGDLDGVVCLRSVAGLGREQAERCAGVARGVVVGRLRAQLPAVMLQAATAWAGSYAEAYLEFERQRDRGELPVVFVPSPAQVVVAKPCDACRTDPATPQSIDSPDGGGRSWQLCADCVVRYEAAGATRSRREALTPRVAQRLRATLAAHGLSGGFPADFAALAATGPRPDTQLALVYADGNRVGQFLQAAADYSRVHGKPAKAAIVTAIDAACQRALARAVAAVGGQTGPLPVLAHVAGGDDVLVSVAAACVWPFVRELLAGFSAELERQTRDWPQPARGGPAGQGLPTMSAGVVLHHRSAPFPDMVRLAARMRDEAKTHTRGRTAAVAFVDVTADGDATPASRRPMTLSDLAAQEQRLAAVAALPAAQRQTLLSLLRIAAHDDTRPAPTAPTETAAEALARRVVDSGALVLWRIAVNDTAPVNGDNARTQLSGDGAARDRLRNALDLARWWPPAPADQPSQPGAGVLSGGRPGGLA
jgi:hypothetical protein